MCTQSHILTNTLNNIHCTADYITGESPKAELCNVIFMCFFLQPSGDLEKFLCDPHAPPQLRTTAG